MRSLSPCCLHMLLSSLKPTTRLRQPLYLNRAVHEIVHARVQGVHFTRLQNTVDDKEAVALQRLPLQLCEVKGR